MVADLKMMSKRPLQDVCAQRSGNGVFADVRGLAALVGATRAAAARRISLVRESC